MTLVFNEYPLSLILYSEGIETMIRLDHINDIKQIKRLKNGKDVKIKGDITMRCIDREIFFYTLDERILSDNYLNTKLPYYQCKKALKELYKYIKSTR
jgi:hypothetical protein